MFLFSSKVIRGCVLTGLGLLFSSFAVQAYDAGDILVRVRGINVSPDESSGIVTLAGTAVAGSSVSVDSDTVPEIDFTYMVSPNIGVELILASSKHDVKGAGTLAAVGKVGSARTLPPVLTLQYHFSPNGKIRPYAGIGANYTLMFNEKSAGALAGTSLKGSSSLGLAGQVGVDIAVDDDWFVNLDVKYVDMDTKLKFSNGSSVKVDINPWIFGVGVGRRF